MTDQITLILGGFVLWIGCVVDIVLLAKRVRRLEAKVAVQERFRSEFR